MKVAYLVYVSFLGQTLKGAASLYSFVLGCKSSQAVASCYEFNFSQPNGMDRLVC